MTSVTDFLKPKFGALSVGDISQKGKAKIAPVVDCHGKAVKLTLSKEPTLRTPWSVSSFDGGDRCTLDIVLTDELEQVCTKIDTEVRSAIEKDTTKHFKNPPKDDWFNSLKKEPSKEGYEGTMGTKLTIRDSSCSFKCWDANKKPMTIQEIKDLHWPSTTFACQVLLKGVYFQSNSCGPMLEVLMLMVKPEDDTCPFGDDDFEFS